MHEWSCSLKVVPLEFIKKKKVSLLFLIFFFVYRKYSVLYLVDEIIVLWLVAIRAMTYIY